MGDIVSEGPEDSAWVSWQCQQKGGTVQDRALCLSWVAASTSLEAAKSGFCRLQVVPEQRLPCPSWSQRPEMGEEGAPSRLEGRGR